MLKARLKLFLSKLPHRQYPPNRALAEAIPPHPAATPGNKGYAGAPLAEGRRPALLTVGAAADPALAAALGMAHWNLCLPGKGLDYVARTLLCALPALKPDAVFVPLPPLPAHEFLRTDGGLTDCGPEAPEGDPVDAVARAEFERLDTLPDRVLSYITTGHLVWRLLDDHGAPWALGWPADPATRHVCDRLAAAGHLPADRLAGDDPAAWFLDRRTAS